MKIAKQRRQKSLEAKRAARQSRPKPEQHSKYLLTLAYDGSSYGGYAKQKHKNTIQNFLEQALASYFGKDIKTTESSRTDAKVHALDQKVMFEMSPGLMVEKVKSQLNELLPKDIVILSLETVPEEFHCRYQVVDKTYEYTLSRILDPRKFNYSWYVQQPLDLARMREAAGYLVGTHDFSTFKSSKATSDTSIRTVNSLEITEEGDHMIIRINGNGFLYNMVRLIVNALIEVGLGKTKSEYVKELLDLQEKPDNFSAAPAQGLCLVKINY